MSGRAVALRHGTRISLEQSPTIPEPTTMLHAPLVTFTYFRIGTIVHGLEPMDAERAISGEIIYMSHIENFRLIDRISHNPPPHIAGY